MRIMIKLGTFLLIYIVCSFTFVPWVARQFGRVPLPVWSERHLRPINYFIVFCNRHYAKPQLRQLITEKANQVNSKFPGSVVRYLDANFPFFNGFPLLPHLSHSDGRKLDLEFFYRNKKGNPINRGPSISGYGIYVSASRGKQEFKRICGRNSSWQYDFTKYFGFGFNSDQYVLDEQRTRFLIDALTSSKQVEKLFIEPYLKERLDLSKNDKVRFQGCHAVRHDDHIHVQIKK